MYITERWGEVPDCGISNAMPLEERFANPAWVERWGHRDRRAHTELALGVLDAG